MPVLEFYWYLFVGHLFAPAVFGRRHFPANVGPDGNRTRRVLATVFTGVCAAGHGVSGWSVYPDFKAVDQIQSFDEYVILGASGLRASFDRFCLLIENAATFEKSSALGCARARRDRVLADFV